MKKLQNNKSVIVLSTEDFNSMGKWGKGFDYYDGNPAKGVIDVFSGGAHYYHSEWDFGFQIVEKPNGDYYVSIASVWQTLMDGDFPISECIEEGFTEKETNKEFLKFLKNGIKEIYKEYTLAFSTK